MINSMAFGEHDSERRGSRREFTDRIDVALTSLYLVSVMSIEENAETLPRFYRSDHMSGSKTWL